MIASNHFQTVRQHDGVFRSQIYILVIDAIIKTICTELYKAAGGNISLHVYRANIFFGHDHVDYMHQ